MPNRKAHYVLSSHWDREWYQTFQDYRYRLVTLLDDILDGIAEGTLTGPFQMDGQSLPIEDYLEVRPERRAFVSECVQQGKLLLGPWYVLPDEFLVSGESMVRNLERGIAVARDLGGKASRTAFVCDIFGHNSQLPQIMSGFGINTGFIWRGVNLPENRHVIWEGTDGTELVCYRFGRIGYCSFAMQVRQANQCATRQTPEALREALDAFIQEQKEAADALPILLFDGCDHQGWDRDSYNIIQERIMQPDGELEYVHSSLDEFASELHAQKDRIKTRLRGELREAAIYPNSQDNQWLIPGVLSSRVWIKQWNHACETALCSQAEPLSVMAASLLARQYPQGYLNVAWGWLLKNHPHDSICGCSIDAVHRDMAFRFHQTQGIAERLSIEATRSIAANIVGDIAPDEMRVTVFNPLTSPQPGPAELELEIPSSWPCFNERFGFEEKPAFRIYDPKGNEIPYQRLAQSMHQKHWRIRYDRTPESYESNTVRVCLPLNVQAFGYTTLTIRAEEPGLPTRHPETPGIASSSHSLENEFLKVSVNNNGSLTLHHKASGETYRDLMCYEDRADIGDGWYHGTAVNDQTFASRASSADIALVQNGPYLATLRIRTHMSLPESFSFETMERNNNWKELIIDSYVTLLKGADHVEVETHIHNTICDHRLCVLFPSQAQEAMTYESDTPFDVVRRPIALDSERHTWREAEPDTHPQQSWTAVCDDEHGLAIVAPGLYEASVRDQPNRPITLTLYRSTQRTVGTNGEPDGQLLENMTFKYWIMPTGSHIDRTQLSQYGQRLACGLLTAQLQYSDVENRQATEELPAQWGMLETKGAGIVSSIRHHCNALEIRLFNPSDSAETETLILDQNLMTGTQVHVVELEGRTVSDELEVIDNTVKLQLRAHGITTIAIQKEGA